MPLPLELQQLTDEVAEQLEQHGLDLCHPLSLAWYNEALPKAIGARIPAQGSAGCSAFCLLVANSKNVWEKFLAACGAVPELVLRDDPLDNYIAATVEAAVENAPSAAGRRHRIFFTHERSEELMGAPAGGGCVAFQRMAHVAGLAYLDEGCHLVIHPKLGTWISLRAVIVFDDLPYDAPAPPPVPNPLDRTTSLYARMALNTAVHSTSKRWSTRLDEADVEAAAATLLESGNEEAHAMLAGLSADTAATLAKAAAAAATSPATSPPTNGDIMSTSPPELSRLPSSACSRRGGIDLAEAYENEKARPCMHAVRANWKMWVAVRDAPNPGHFWRFPQDMLTYHYTSDKAVLVDALRFRGLLPAPASPDRLNDAVAVGSM